MLIDKAPESELGPLEYEEGEQRKRVEQALLILWDETRKRSIRWHDDGKQEARRAVVELAIQLFLRDVEFSELD